MHVRYQGHLMIRKFDGAPGADDVIAACVTVTDLPPMVSVAVRTAAVMLRAAV
jgi:hypothetical protein